MRIYFLIILIAFSSCNFKNENKPLKIAHQPQIIRQLVKEYYKVEVGDSVYFCTYKDFYKDNPEIIIAEMGFRSSSLDSDTLLFGKYSNYYDNGSIKNVSHYILGKKYGWSTDYGLDTLRNYSAEYKIVGKGRMSIKNRWIEYDSLGEIDYNNSFMFNVKSLEDSPNLLTEKLPIKIEISENIFIGQIKMVINNYNSAFELQDSSNFQVYEIDQKIKELNVSPQLDKHGNKFVKGYLLFGEDKHYFDLKKGW